MSRFPRFVPAIGAAAVLGIGSAGSTALAHDSHHHHHGHGATHRYSAADKQYLQTAIEGDLFEIAGGKLAQQRGASQKVKDYGARLVADHTKSLGDATDLAKKLGIQVPTGPTPAEQWELQTLAKFTGSEIDATYADLEAKDHQQDISEAQDEVKDGTNSEVRHSAKDEIPTLQEHLKIAEDLGGKQATDPLGG